MDYMQVRSKYLDKGQSKRIWAELYKVIDSSDVVIQARLFRALHHLPCCHLSVCTLLRFHVDEVGLLYPEKEE